MIMGRKTKTGLLVLITTLLVWLGSPIPGSAAGQEETGEATMGVFVSILPQAYLVERIGGDRVQVEVLVTPGQSPHTFEPTPQQMTRLAEAALYFRIGVEFENSLMPRIESTMQSLEVVDCRQGIRLRAMETHHHPDEGDHGEEEHHEEGEESHEEDEHDHEGTDPHVWLSVRNATQMAATMRDALVRLDASGKSDYERGYLDLVADLEALDRSIAAILEPVRGKPFFVFHPAFGYFADDYGLQQIAVETGGSEPSARQLAHLIEEARDEGVRVIFVQPQFSKQSAQTVAAEIGGAVVPIDPLARDYIDNLEQMARAVEEGLR